MRTCAVVLAISWVWTAGCSGPGEGDGGDGVTPQALTAARPLAGFVVLAARTIEVGERTTITGGDLGVAAGVTGRPGLLIAGAASRVGVGHLSLAEKIVLREGAAIGDIAGDRLEAARGAVTGTRSPFFSPPAAPTPGAVAAGTIPVVVRSGRTRSLAAGRYGDLSVRGHLTLDGGVYEIRSLHLGPGARVTALAPTVVRMATGLQAAERARIGPAPPLRAGDLRLLAAGTIDGEGNSFSLSDDGQLTALAVGRGTFHAGDGVHVVGAISARRVIAGRALRLSFESGFGCADAPDGTACDDGQPCTGGDSCQGGLCRGGAWIVTEYPSGLIVPDAITAGPDGNLWFISAESTPGAADGTVARIAPATGRVTAFPVGRRLLDITAGADGNLWLAERLPAAENALWALGRITPSGMFLDELVGLPADRIASGPDGNIWFVSAVEGTHIAGSLRPTDGLITALLFVSNEGRRMTRGPDGNVWMTESNGGASPARIASITPDGALREWPVSTPGDLNAIVAGADGNLWFTDEGSNEIGRISTGGVITKFPVPTAASGLHGIAASTDGTIWFTQRTANRVGRITLGGQVTELACIPTAGSGPTAIAAAADGRLWFTGSRAGTVATLRPPP